jgi:hypothetical protein
MLNYMAVRLTVGNITPSLLQCVINKRRHHVIMVKKTRANISRENSNFISPKRQLNCEVVP